MHVDHLHAGGELGVLLGRHLARHEDAEMADRLVQRVDDGLPVGDDLVLVRVEVGDPAQRLLRRRDVVAPRAEHDDRRADVAQVDADAVEVWISPEVSLLPTKRLSAIHCISPAFSSTGLPHQVSKSRKRVGLGVDLGIEVVGLVPVGVGRIQRFEVGDQIGAVEDAVAEVAGQRRQPGAAQRAAEVAHRVLAAHARPVRQRRAGQQDRPEQFGPDRGHHHDLPAGLAVADRSPACLPPRDGGDATSSTKAASAMQTSSIVWPGIGSGRKPTK